jgi:hypothetical protein
LAQLKAALPKTAVPKPAPDIFIKSLLVLFIGVIIQPEARSLVKH